MRLNWEIVFSTLFGRQVLPNLLNKYAKNLTSQTFFLSILIAGGLSLLMLLLIPGDAKNARFHGISPSMRLVMLGGMLFSVLAAAWLTYSAFRAPEWYKKFIRRARGLFRERWAYYQLVYNISLGFRERNIFSLHYIHEHRSIFTWVFLSFSALVLLAYIHLWGITILSHIS